jgi:hypothetical protein
MTEGGIVHKANSTVQTRRSLPTSGMDEEHNRCRFWKTSPAHLLGFWKRGSERLQSFNNDKSKAF